LKVKDLRRLCRRDQEGEERRQFKHLHAGTHSSTAHASIFKSDMIVSFFPAFFAAPLGPDRTMAQS
jgi:hypothetical protein